MSLEADFAFSGLGLLVSDADRFFIKQVPVVAIVMRGDRINKSNCCQQVVRGRTM
jgi:hypothetical protein